MNRLTHEIGLVLITSSLMLQGCDSHPQTPGYEFAKEKDQLPAEAEDVREDSGGGGDFDADASPPGSSAKPGTPGSSHYHSPIHHGGHVPIFIPLGRSSRSTSSGPAPSGGFHTGPATSSGSRSTTGSSVGGSARGGFGATGHGVSS